MPIRAYIQDLPFTLLRAEDKQYLSQLGYNGKVRWLEERVDLVLISPYRRSLDRWEENQLGMFLVSGLCAGISAASTFMNGKRAPAGEDRKYFLSFVETYMAQHEPTLMDPPTNVTWRYPNRKPNTWADWLYLYIRNGLAHAFSIEQGGFHQPQPSFILQADVHEPVVDARRLLNCFEVGWRDYLQAVRTAGPSGTLGEKFENRWDELFLWEAPSADLG